MSRKHHLDLLLHVIAHGSGSATQRLTLLALAAHANDDLESFPSALTIAKLVGVGEGRRQTIYRLLGELEASGQIVQTGRKVGRSPVYRLVPASMTTHPEIKFDRQTGALIEAPIDSKNGASRGTDHTRNGAPIEAPTERVIGASAVDGLVPLASGNGAFAAAPNRNHEGTEKDTEPAQAPAPAHAYAPAHAREGDLFLESGESPGTARPAATTVRVTVVRSPASDIRVARQTPEGERQAGDFETFWAAYPLKQSKQDASKAWDKLSPGPELVARIMAGLEAAKASEQWRLRRVIPHASTWLNKARWEDEHQPSEAETRAARDAEARRLLFGGSGSRSEAIDALAEEVTRELKQQRQRWDTNARRADFELEPGDVREVPDDGRSH